MLFTSLFSPEVITFRSYEMVNDEVLLLISYNFDPSTISDLCMTDNPCLFCTVDVEVANAFCIGELDSMIPRSS